MTDLEIVELAARRAANVFAEQNAFKAFADELLNLSITLRQKPDPDDEVPF